jgi:transketolase
MTTISEPIVAGDLAPAADDLDGRAVATVRMLALDAVQAAASGHPGLPMGAAVPAWAIFSRFLRHDPTAADWPDRDRFVLSAGHGSALLYALLHLFGYDLPIEELRNFRQWGSRTPGHPEYGHTVGVETTTGPLGQGLATAVGMALAERMLAARCNEPDREVMGHRTWVLASDGDLMEGISHEAASLAGHLGLGRLIVLHDDNDITIDGAAHQSCTDDTATRFSGYGWHTLRVDDGNDLDAVVAALNGAVDEVERPTLISVRTVIGYGAPTVAGTAKAHGTPLSPEELALTRARFGWPDEPFHIPSDVAEHCAQLAARGRDTRQRWERDCAQRWTGWVEKAAGNGRMPDFAPGDRLATRVASGKVLQALVSQCPGLVGGSADLAGSTGTALSGESPVHRDDYTGRLIHFGIREHGMAAALNGMALHGGLRPFGSTFLVFSDYLRPALRLSALMGLPVVYVFTHDSVAVGEDGPTHQPVEHVEALRLIPGLTVLRPADAHETAACWELALQRQDGPTALILSRQSLPALDPPPAGAVAEDGGWAVRDPANPEVVLVAAGSEVALAVSAADELQRSCGPVARVVSVPWRERFTADGYHIALVPDDIPAVWIEAGVRTGWQALARPGDAVIGLDRFGASAPGPKVYAELGFTAERVATAARQVVETAQRVSVTAGGRSVR